jgi:hypothetical protein
MDVGGGHHRLVAFDAGLVLDAVGITLVGGTVDQLGE